LKLDSLGKKLSFAGNFYKNDNDTEVNFSTLTLPENTIQDVKTLSKINLRFSLFKAIWNSFFIWND
jgi:hypothetical protein